MHDMASTAMNRINRLTRHLVDASLDVKRTRNQRGKKETYPENPHGVEHDPIEAKRKNLKTRKMRIGVDQRTPIPRKILEETELEDKAWHDRIIKQLPSPCNDKKRYPCLVDVLVDLDDSRIIGSFHEKLADWSRYSSQGMSGNFVIPIRENVPRIPAKIVDMIVISDPEDCERLAREHVTKPPNYQRGFYHSLISTDDPRYWMKQRKHLNPAFLPVSSLSKIFPITAARARGGGAQETSTADQGWRRHC